MIIQTVTLTFGMIFISSGEKSMLDTCCARAGHMVDATGTGIRHSRRDVDILDATSSLLYLNCQKEERKRKRDKKTKELEHGNDAQILYVTVTV